VHNFADTQQIDNYLFLKIDVMKKKYRIEFERDICIGAAACVTENPSFWSLEPDGKATAKGEDVKKKKQIVKVELTSKELEKHLLAAKSCPVNAIHVFDEETNEQIV